MPKSLKQIQKDVEKFCTERGWKNDGPNQLIVSLMIELSELAEHYQWQLEFKEHTEIEKKEIGYEFVDVLFYLIRLANKTGIDIEDSFYDKLPKLEKKFAIGKDPKQAKDEYRKNGKNKLYD